MPEVRTGVEGQRNRTSSDPRPDSRGDVPVPDPRGRVEERVVNQVEAADTDRDAAATT
jgi:hypothetical protein